jgi:DnaK suppressor protein
MAVSAMIYKRQLKSRLNELVGMRDRHIALIKALNHAEYLSSSDVLDIGQGLAFLHSEAALVRTLQGQIERVSKALHRALEGIDGQCEGCRGVIPDERREILPEATRCVLCQEKWEKLRCLRKTDLESLTDRCPEKPMSVV